MILTIDAGTTGITALVVQHDLKIISEASLDFPQYFPKPGFVEHDLKEIWTTTQTVIQKCLENIDPKQISSIGITNQRETICFWDKSLQPSVSNDVSLSRAIVWQDRRTTQICEQLHQRDLSSLFQAETGLVLDPYFSGTKIKWALENFSAVTEAFHNGKLKCGTIDSFLIWMLTDGQSHTTDSTNASRTLLMNLKRRSWDTDLCRLLDVPKDILPEILPSNGNFGKTKNLSILPDGIPITGVIGDQQSALLGQMCIEKGQAKCTYGTGAFLLMNIGEKPIYSQHRLLSTLAWDLGKCGGANYALEGSTFVAGAAVQWFRDGLKMIEHASDIELLANEVQHTDGLTFVPALTGLGAPYWNPNATGMFTGITRGTTKAHFARAILEGIAFQVHDVLKAMEKDCSFSLKSLHVDGGAASNNLLMQIQSNFVQSTLKRPQQLETTSLGAVFASGLGNGVWNQLSDLITVWKLNREFHPQINEQEAQIEKARWDKAIQKVCHS